MLRRSGWRIGMQTNCRHALRERCRGGDGWEAPAHRVFTLVARKRGYVITKKLKARANDQAIGAMLQAIAQHRGRLRTFTLDNGTKFQDYAVLERFHPARCYFATPYYLLGARQQRKHQRADPAAPIRGKVYAERSCRPIATALPKNPVTARKKVRSPNTG